MYNKPDRSVESCEKIFEIIKRILKKHPDLRFGQIVVNSLPSNKDLYCIENEDLFQYLKDCYKL